MNGPVSFLAAGDNDWVQATPNRPLWTGDRLWTGSGARAELQIGGAALRLAPETSITVINFDDRIAQFEVTQGAVQFRVRTIDSGDTIEIDTPNLAYSVRQPGDYRVDVAPDGGFDECCRAARRGRRIRRAECVCDRRRDTLPLPRHRSHRLSAGTHRAA
jgi:hypothetical protein